MDKNCIYCGKDLSKWNLNFTRDIICDTCTQRKCLGIENLERASNIDIANRKSFEVACEKHENNTSMEGLGSELKELRKRKGFSLGAVAVRLGISSSYLSKMESGCKPLSLKALELLEGEKARNTL